MIFDSIKKLVTYGLEKGLIEKEDKVYIINQLISTLNLTEYEDSTEEYIEVDLEPTLKELCDYAVEQKIIEEGTTSRDLFDTKLMGILTPRPSEVIRRFNEEYLISPEKATDYFYKLSKDTDYIRCYRVKKDLKWVTNSSYGDIDITINLSKPEKDPKAIALAKTQKQSGYPKCPLCKESEGYSGRFDFPARENHRIIPIVVNDTPWCLQYSPYVYYNEHCIVLNSEHTPMAINKATFDKLLSFVSKFPHYFLGSNADLPIVGGSILSHDHFQGGRYEFAMAKAPIEKGFVFDGFSDISAGIVKWPMSTIRIKGKDKGRLSLLADKVLKAWISYTDEDAFIFAETNGERHNTITPIARKKDGMFELDLVLRNNITTEEHPLGVYHPHKELHNIKKENIGLIEVMGLAVLPARLKEELKLLGDALMKGDLTGDERILKHKEWAESFRDKYTFTKENVDGILKEEVGKTFVKVLEDAGVYKCTKQGREAFYKFIKSV